MYRMANFVISKNLDKADKMPNRHQWKVSERERCIEGPILLYLRSKGRFFDRVVQPGLRYCVLTKRGFLLIYMTDEKGFLLDIRRAFEIKSLSDNVSVMRTQYRRCRIKIRFLFGTVNIILTNGKIDLWRDHLLNATASPPISAPLRSIAPSSTAGLRNLYSRPIALTRTGPNNKGVANTPHPAACPVHGPLANVETSPSLVALKPLSSYLERQVSTKEDLAEVKTATREPSETSVYTAVDFSTCDDEFEWMSSGLSPIDEEPSVTTETSTSDRFNFTTVREVTVPVEQLGRAIEPKMDADRCPAIDVAPVEISTMTASEEAPTMAELPIAQTTVHMAPKSKKQVKFSIERSTPVKTSAKPVASDSSSFNSFQFWRQSVFESNV